MPSYDYDTIICGAGAAGLVAAIHAAERGRKVLLLEKGKKPGVKILMSGGTRCEVIKRVFSNRLEGSWMKKLRAIVFGGEHQWDGNAPASESEISDLIAWSPVSLPAEYLELLKLSNGGHASLAGYPSYARIWPAETAIKSNQDYEVQERVPGFVAFGDDGGEVLIGFDTRAGLPYPVRAVPFTPMEWIDATDVASGFKEFIGRMLASE